MRGSQSSAVPHSPAPRPRAPWQIFLVLFRIGFRTDCLLYGSLTRSPVVRTRAPIRVIGTVGHASGTCTLATTVTICGQRSAERVTSHRHSLLLFPKSQKIDRKGSVDARHGAVSGRALWVPCQSGARPVTGRSRGLPDVSSFCRPASSALAVVVVVGGASAASGTRPERTLFRGWRPTMAATALRRGSTRGRSSGCRARRARLRSPPRRRRGHRLPGSPAVAG